jgi:hypothetical protein
MKQINYDQLTFLDLSDLKDDYLKIFEKALQDGKSATSGVITPGLETRWVQWKANNDPKGTIPETVEDLLIGDFRLLLSVYQRFLDLKILAKVDDGNGNMIDNSVWVDLVHIFHYTDGYDERIADFFYDKSEQLGITTCYYCEMAYINTYSVTKDDGTRGKRRQFDVDHFLPKGDCPCLALSLFNFIPSCQVCNSRIKLKGLPAVKTLSDLAYLSPSSPVADFENKIKIRLRFSNKKKGEQRYIYFEADYPYNKYIQFFHLQERYGFHRKEAIRLKELKKRYPDTKIEKIAKLLNYRKTKVKEDIFRQKYLAQEGRCFAKFTNDLLTE